ncbi:MAG: argininosuccinate lyase, partial [Armatimonadetes bacterium]|nr:argininosuccinate lyase [Armatimonadota bacterium]
MNVEWYLREGAGPEMGGRLHTARSRNDQVVTDARMHLRIRLLDVVDEVVRLQRTLLDIASRHVEDVMPGYTHTQHAQPISVGFWLSAHAAGLARDVERLQAAFERTNKCALGACALAGTSLPTNRRLTARLLGFDGLVEHALDAVQSRDFILEALAALAILAANLSRLSEDIVLFSTYEFGMIELADEMASGSSIMPQKKNPCLAELARARTGRTYGRLVQALTMMKGIPSGYNRDLQEDKPPVWEALDSVEETVGILTAMVSTMTMKVERMRELAGANFAAATELANWLVRERRLPFREAHEIVGGIVGTLVREGRSFDDIDRVLELLAERGQPADAQTLRQLLDPAECMRRHRSEGSTGPEEVRRQIARLAAAADAAGEWSRQRRAEIAAARETVRRIVAHVLSGGAIATAGLPEV